LYGGGTNDVRVHPDELIEEAVDVFVYLVLLIEAVDGTKALDRFAAAIRKKMRTNRERMEARGTAGKA